MTEESGQYDLPKPDEKKSHRNKLTPELMRAIRQIESGGKANARTGSYKGLYQLSDAEFKRLGGRGDIFNPQENERIAALKLQHEADQVSKRLGRPLTPAEIYLVHQQGVGGAPEHIQNPKRSAWESMYATGEGQAKGPGWAKKAIWGNIPDQDKKRFGSVENVTSEDFAKLWAAQIARRGGGEGSTTVADAAPPAQYSSPESAAAANEAERLRREAEADAKARPASGGGIGSDRVASERVGGAPDTTVADTIAKNDQKDYGNIIGSALEGLGQTMAAGAPKMPGTTPANAPMASLPTPQGPMPMANLQQAQMQRQQLAAILQRLNSGRLV